ncbi:Tiparp [Symbiodinium natans]|uniref:Poly [ADP-ribose] polymerase n=1 Tax=Symbiodinium natans TaxID=878477 RepID=A0A812HUE7_9DINO|nr:Tiparp [Symbiodinium natans]
MRVHEQLVVGTWGREMRQAPRTLLGRRTTHVVQPFLSKTWGYRESDLSAKELNLKANELWLFHGTRESAAESITENEFQLKMAGTNRGTMFGPGIYMADAVRRALSCYEERRIPADLDGPGIRILCRCTMGRAIKQFEGGRECMKACHAGGFHSVKGLRAYNAPWRHTAEELQAPEDPKFPNP